MITSGLGFCGNYEDEKNREKISSLDLLLLLSQVKSKIYYLLTGFRRSLVIDCLFKNYILRLESIQYNQDFFFGTKYLMR